VESQVKEVYRCENVNKSLLVKSLAMKHFAA
jgi:hypothetical protein